MRKLLICAGFGRDTAEAYPCEWSAGEADIDEGTAAAGYDHPPDAATVAELGLEPGVTGGREDNEADAECEEICR